MCGFNYLWSILKVFKLLCSGNLRKQNQFLMKQVHLLESEVKSLKREKGKFMYSIFKSFALTTRNCQMSQSVVGACYYTYNLLPYWYQLDH